MKNLKSIHELQGRPFNGRVHLRIKRIKTEPRQKIRQLLRSFVPLDGTVTDMSDKQ
ncbi:hypothetical protein [Daejeonella sp. JGW-45]|uniref:hypothetical protein n=1 Tax=Daejeonella sp. JGW-45 TaxID=3034148 RepID=UPI0023EAFCAE|nr:hypothetical protein [Daejeonella sp. JGW-45]